MATWRRRHPHLFAWGTGVGLLIPWIVSLWVVLSAWQVYCPVTAGGYGVAVPGVVRGLWAAAGAGALLSLAAVLMGALSGGLRRWQSVTLCLLALGTLAVNAPKLAALIAPR